MITMQLVDFQGIELEINNDNLGNVKCDLSAVYWWHFHYVLSYVGCLEAEQFGQFYWCNCFLSYYITLSYFAQLKYMTVV